MRSRGRPPEPLEGSMAVYERGLHAAILATVLATDPLPTAILDIGCGNGDLTSAIAQRLPNAAITGIDPVPPKRNSADKPYSFIQASIEQLPFDSETFDVAIASMSMHHWDDKAKGIAEAYRVLKPGGLLVIGDPLLEGWLARPRAGRIVQRLDGGSFADAAELAAYFSQAGFAEPAISLVPKTLKALYLITTSKPL